MACQIKRQCDKVEPKIRESILIRIDGKHCIHINKNQFKIGSAKYNDEIISDIAISRKHCIFRYEDNKWKLEDLSISETFINNIAVLPNIMQDVSPGDVIQFSANIKFKYIFAHEDNVKKVSISKKYLIMWLSSKKHLQRIKCERKEVKDIIKQTAVKNNEKNLLRKIAILEDKLQKSIATSQQKEQKWQKALDMKKQKISLLKKQIQILKDEAKIKFKEIVNNEFIIINDIIIEFDNIEEYIKNLLARIERTQQYINNIMNEQFTCSICLELFVKATRLNCSHIFCQYCINNWSKIQINCPICREPVIAIIEQPVLDHFIEEIRKLGFLLS